MLPVSDKKRQNGNLYLLAEKLEISQDGLFLYKIYKDANVWNLDLGKTLLQNHFYEKKQKILIKLNKLLGFALRSFLKL